MTRKLPARLILILLFSVAGCGFLQPVVRQSGPAADAETRLWQSEIEQRGRDGDWLAIRGYSPSDHLVAAVAGAELSHVGILDATRGEVIEAVSPTVRSAPLGSFLNAADRVVLIRPRGAGVHLGRLALRRARSKVGVPYDFLGTVGLPDTDRFYCSELAAWSVGEDVDVRGPEQVLHPASMSKLGTVLFDSGKRTGDVDQPVEINSRN